MTWFVNGGAVIGYGIVVVAMSFIELQQRVDVHDCGADRMTWFVNGGAVIGYGIVVVAISFVELL
jgi:hypothetical protein